jgi:hypothetical protein
MPMRIMPSNGVGPSVRAPSCDPDCRCASVLQQYLYDLITIAMPSKAAPHFVQASVVIGSPPPKPAPQPGRRQGHASS